MKDHRRQTEEQDIHDRELEALSSLPHQRRGDKTVGARVGITVGPEVGAVGATVGAPVMAAMVGTRVGEAVWPAGREAHVGRREALPTSITDLSSDPTRGRSPSACQQVAPRRWVACSDLVRSWLK